MRPNTSEQSGDTIVLLQNTKILRKIGIILIAMVLGTLVLLISVAFVTMGLGVLAFIIRSVNTPVKYLFPGIELIIGSILIYKGGSYTYTFNRTIKTFSRQIKTGLRNTTETWRFNDIKDVVLKAQHIHAKGGAGYYVYQVIVILESGKKIKVFTHRRAEESEKVLQLIRQQIF